MSISTSLGGMVFAGMVLVRLGLLVAWGTEAGRFAPPAAIPLAGTMRHGAQGIVG